MIEGSFPRLKDPSQFEEDKEIKVILRLMVQLYNFQTSQTGINQIMSLSCENTGCFGYTRINNSTNRLV